MTVRELFDRMDWSEFNEWAIFYANDPWGDLRADRRTALLAMQFHNAHRGRNTIPAKLDDFMLYQPFKRPESDEEAGQRLVAQASALRSRISMRKAN